MKTPKLLPTAALLMTLGVAGWFGYQESHAGTRIENQGVEVDVPSGWTWNDALLAEGGPLSITNSNTAFDRGGILTPDAIEVDITHQPAPPEGLAEFVKKELVGAEKLDMRETPVADAGGLKATYEDSFVPGLRYANVSYYIVKGGTLYKFYLTFRADNNNLNAAIQTFDGMMNSVKLP